MFCCQVTHRDATSMASGTADCTHSLNSSYARASRCLLNAALDLAWVTVSGADTRDLCLGFGGKEWGWRGSRTCLGCREGFTPVLGAIWRVCKREANWSGDTFSLRAALVPSATARLQARRLTQGKIVNVLGCELVFQVTCKRMT